MRKYLALSLCLLMLACTPAPKFMPIGDRVGAPIGADAYCKRHQTDEKCIPSPTINEIRQSVKGTR